MAWRGAGDSNRELVDCAMGRLAADLVIRGGRWVSVQSGEIIANTDLAAKGSRIAYVGEDASRCVGRSTQVIEARGRFLVPGLIDGHLHVESGMLTVTEFVRAVVPHGTTSLMIDPHEIANVFGLAGVRMMVDEAALQPIQVWVQVPSCIPSSPGLETPGADLGPAEVAEALAWPGVIGLGEVMDYRGVAANEEKMCLEIEAARRAGKVVGGHYSSLDLGQLFHGYVAGGAEDDHEGTRLEDAVARARQGLGVMMRYGSAWHDVAAQAQAVTRLGLDARHFILVTDDCHAGTLVNEGHMDRVVRHAIRQGVPPVTAIQMATLNPAEHFGVSRQVGLLAPGRVANVLLVGTLEDMDVEEVIAGGKRVANRGQWLVDLPVFAHPDAFRHSVHLARPLAPPDFEVKSSGNPSTRAHVIGVVENQAPTRHLQLDLQVRAGSVQMDLGRDVAKVALVERHRASGRIQVGFVSGFKLQGRCAVASTVAHDSHQMLVVGTDERDMAIAANELARVEGGMVVVREGVVRATVELPIGGLMSTERAHIIAAKADRVLGELRACGCTLNNANMQLSLLALVVIPELRISDKGLIDVERFRVIPVVEA